MINWGKYMNERLPLKWQKYLLLVDFNLISLSELNSQIKRYKNNELYSMIADIREQILYDQHVQQKFIYVVKCVPFDLHFKLPNYRIFDISDLIHFETIYNTTLAEKYPEIWYCKTRIDDSADSVAGRIYFQTNELGYGQVIEQIWNRSPRYIDTLSSQSDFPYIRASRDGWSRKYVIEKLHNPCPSKSTVQMQRQFYRSVAKIEGMRNKIELFGEFLESLDLAIFCLEYKRIDDDFLIIDWDSSNDMKVLKSE